MRTATIIFWLCCVSVDLIVQSRISKNDFLCDPKEKDDFIYLGYANNPFGPSRRLPNKNGLLNSTLKHLIHMQINTDIDNSVESSNDETRSKRGVLELYNMVSCATGCNPLIYKGYGCYCGFLGSGYTVNGIDSCCKMHDWCYNKANCPIFLEYFMPYFWKCYRGKPFCAIEHGELGGYNSCAQNLCECDRALSECLKKFPCPQRRKLCFSSPLRLFQNALMLF